MKRRGQDGQWKLYTAGGHFSNWLCRVRHTSCDYWRALQLERQHAGAGVHAILLTVGQVAGCLIVFGEWWASEVAVMSAGLLPDAERSLSAMAIYQNTNDLGFTVSIGLSIACATR